MKKLAIIILIIVAVTTTGCGRVKAVDGTVYDTYGLFTVAGKKNPDIEYRLIVGNVIWGIILCETVIAPIYFFGFSLFEPVGKIDSNKPKGAIQ